MTSAEVVSPWVEVQLIGGDMTPLEATEARRLKTASLRQWRAKEPKFQQVSKTIEGNGLLPKWNFNVNCLVWDPRLCFVRFAVFTQRRMRRPLLLAYEVVPVACLRQGYRAVPL